MKALQQNNKQSKTSQKEAKSKVRAAQVPGECAMSVHPACARPWGYNQMRQAHCPQGAEHLGRLGVGEGEEKNRQFPNSVVL